MNHQNQHEQIANGAMFATQVNIAGGKFYADETMWAQIMYVD
jgi:hypothetical protein